VRCDRARRSAAAEYVHNYVDRARAREVREEDERQDAQTRRLRRRRVLSADAEVAARRRRRSIGEYIVAGGKLATVIPGALFTKLQKAIDDKAFEKETRRAFRF
jgi:hypothetical protein